VQKWHTIITCFGEFMPVKDHLEFQFDATLLIEECIAKLIEEGFSIDVAREVVQKNFKRINFNNQEILDAENLCRQ
jgi:hypothetical protein